jgi:Spherulation-specific family 4/Ca-dependent carbohydrate-binding module xylan-binding
VPCECTHTRSGSAGGRGKGITIRSKLVLIVFVLATSGATFAWQASAAAPLLTTLHAEQMNLPAGASSVRDRSADAGRAAEFTRNGVASAAATITAPVTSLTVTARGSQCSRAWPQLQLAINGVVVLNAIANSTGWTSYSASGLNVPAGTHTVTLTVSNTSQSRNCNRSLVVDVVGLYGEDVPPPPPPDPVAGCLGVIVPAYSYPNPPSFWDNSIAAANPVQFMIADPANGPGKSKDSNYVAVIARAKAAGIRVMGYVDTAYANRSAKTVKTDITTWRTMYGLTDIFFDQTASGASSLAYYRDIASAVHATPGAITMLNPGVNVDEGYLEFSDILNIFEGSRSDYAGFAPASWVGNYPSSRFSHLIYGVPDAAGMTTVLNQSITQRAGYVYITSDTMPNPWDSLPPYWATEVAQIRQACAATV